MLSPARFCTTKTQLRHRPDRIPWLISAAAAVLSYSATRSRALTCFGLVAGRGDPELNDLRPSAKVSRQCLGILALSTFDRHSVFELLATLT